LTCFVIVFQFGIIPVLGRELSGISMGSGFPAIDRIKKRYRIGRARDLFLIFNSAVSLMAESADVKLSRVKRRKESRCQVKCFNVRDQYKL
jgi:hypothetical protein